MACKKALVYEWIRLVRAAGINVDNDLEACFDNMVEACHALACHSKGANQQYLYTLRPSDFKNTSSNMPKAYQPNATLPLLIHHGTAQVKGLETRHYDTLPNPME